MVTTVNAGSVLIISNMKCSDNEASTDVGNAEFTYEVVNANGDSGWVWSIWKSMVIEMVADAVEM